MITMLNKTKKPETLITRFTSGRNFVYYPEEVITPMSNLKTMKINVISIISKIKSQYICMDVKDFYLNICMDRSEHIMVHISIISEEFIIE